MNYNITKFQIKVLTWIAERISIQSNKHKSNIIEYYKIMTRVARKRFNEDNRVTLDDFLTECFFAGLDDADDQTTRLNKQIMYHNNKRYQRLESDDIIEAGAIMCVDFGLPMPIFSPDTIGKTPAMYSPDREFFNLIKGAK